MINKQIIFSLLLMASAAINGMEIETNDVLKEMVLYSYDIVPHITEQLWTDRHYPTAYVGKAIRALSCTNTFFYDYYSAENNKKTIIRAIARNNYESDESAALILKFHPISEKIKYFIDIAHNKDGRFRQEDLKEKWYLNVTDYMGRSLAYIAIANNNVDKAQLIINHSGSECLDCGQLSRLETAIFWKILNNENNKNNLDKLKALHCELDNECDLGTLKILRSVVQNKILLCKQNAQC
jgi:hypothetical protein